MLFVNRRARKSNQRRASLACFQPRCEGLEAKVLLTVNLGLFSPPNNPNIAGPTGAPFGMDFGAGNLANIPTATSQRAGAGVADLGDVNGDGFEDYAIASPGTASGQNSYVSVVFGSNTLPAGTVSNWIGTNGATPPVFNYTPNNRVGDLSQLGITAPAQTNPISGTALALPFSGVTFVSLTNILAGMSSVAGVNIGGRQGLLIGAPGAQDASGANPGTGRAYLIFGNFNTYAGQTVDLDNPANYPNLTIVTFTSTATLGGLGTSVAGGVNIFGDGSADIILGAPEASVGAQTNSGAVYILSTALLNGSDQTINVTTLGQAGTQSLILAGANAGDRAGFSAADAGDVNAVTSGGINVDDLLVGAPQSSSSAGNAYLLYGGSTLAGLATTTSGVRYINLNRVGTTGTGAVPGAVFTGAVGGAGTGSAVSSAGDFNGDGVSDILIGAPTFSGGTTSTNQGAAYLFYGAPSTSSGFLTGTFNLASIPSTLPSVTFTGANAGDMAGSSVSLMGVVNAGQPNEILIGAPGFNSSSGTAYLIPGQTSLSGTFSLGAAEAAPLSGVQFILNFANSGSFAPNLFGASVSGRLQTTTNTADADNEGDFIVGSPGYNVNQTAARDGAGGAQIVEGGLITVPIPTSNQVTVQIGVGKAFAPFSINASTPANLQIFVFGSTATTPNFMPVTDINPATVTVNGVLFSGATLQQDPNTNNYLFGIPDAIITINPRSLLKLPNGVDTITVTGQTLASSLLPNFTWTGTAVVTVTGGSVSPVIGALAGVPTGPDLLTEFLSPYGANQYTPSISALSAFNYQPIPVSVALAQFLPPQGFRQRIYSFNHPGKTTGPYLTSRGQNKGRASGINTLSSKVYDRSRFHGQKDYNYTHKGPKVGILKGVIPSQATRQHFGDNLIP